jgi:hypothetical protein
MYNNLVNIGKIPPQPHCEHSKFSYPSNSSPPIYP